MNEQLWLRFDIPQNVCADSRVNSCVTTDFAYIRLLGDRKGIERQTKVWDKVIVDRSAELQSWVSFCQKTVRRGIPTYVYINNHYSGHAPATVAQFLDLWNAKT